METREFVVSIFVDDLDEDKQEDVIGSIRKAISNEFELDDGISFEVSELWSIYMIQYQTIKKKLTTAS